MTLEYLLMRTACKLNANENKNKLTVDMRLRLVIELNIV